MLEGVCRLVAGVAVHRVPVGCHLRTIEDRPVLGAFYADGSDLS